MGRYVEANALRARLVERAEDWRWSSLGAGDGRYRLPLAAWPVDRPHGWGQVVNEALEAEPLESVRTSVRRGRPFGSAAWVEATARRLNITSSIRPLGRPKKTENRQK